MLVKDHYHLKTKVWPEYLRLNKYTQLQRHLEGALNCRTQLEFKQHKSDLYIALADRPKDIDYFREYFDNPESIARYKILGVRGSLGMVTSSNAEAGHASHEHSVPTQMIGISKSRHRNYWNAKTDGYNKT